MPVHVNPTDPLTIADAERLGYVLTRADCRLLLKIRHDDLGELLAGGTLPSVRVQSRGGLAYRVRPADLEQLGPGRHRHEVDASEMARLVSAELGFDVSPSAVTRAARENKITVRVARRGQWFYTPEVVLAEIRAGAWRPHRAAASRRPPRERECVNVRCTNGEDGGRARQLVHESRYDQSRSGWACCADCRKAVGKARRQDRTVKRPCACDGCGGVVWVTKRQASNGTGQQRCDACKAANRSTRAKRTANSHNLSRMLEDPAFAQASAARREGVGLHNSHSPKHMHKLISGRMTRHAADRDARIAAVTAALTANPSESNSSLMRRLRCGWPMVAAVRADLEEQGAIPMRAGVPQKRPPDTEPNEIIAAVRKRASSRATRRGIEAGEKAAARRKGRDDLDSAIAECLARGAKVVDVAARLHVSERRIQQAARRKGFPAGKPGRPRST